MRNQTHLQTSTVAVAPVLCTKTHTDFDFWNPGNAPSTVMKIISGDCPGLSWDEDKLKRLSHEMLCPPTKDVVRGSLW